MILKHSKFFLISMLIAATSALVFAQEEFMFEKGVEKERGEFKYLLIENPNYFGTHPEFEIKPVKLISNYTKYEELTCLGFYPEEDLLEAIVDVKLPYGYKGDLCSAGSYEYVRFFADWNDDGDFKDEGEDLGLSAVNVHNIPNGKQKCLKTFKPFSYSLPLKLDSIKLRSCKVPYLVKIKAILSWEVQPTTGNPDYPPVWGNTVEKWVQIRPHKLLWVDVMNINTLKEMQIDTSLLTLDQPDLKIKSFSENELQEIYKGKDIPELRYKISSIYQQTLAIKKDPMLMTKYKLDPKYKEFLANVNIILEEKSNTNYEEVHCIGLNYDQDQLVASLTVKLPTGYNGNLCTNGSNEYVAFWAYAYDQIEQQCIWRYLGTSSVNTHDIQNIPAEGLQYAVYLPVDLSSYKEKCGNPKVMKVRAILSWNIKPPTYDPNYNPIWGNKVDALIQIKPGKLVQEGVNEPFIWGVGGMAVESVSGNPFTTISSAIGDGYANGVSVGGGYNAVESPFGGIIKISGSISHAPNISEGVTKLKYKVQYRGFTEIIWHDISNKFKIWRRFNSVPSGSYWQNADANGYFEYQKDLVGTNIIEVQDDIMAQWPSTSLSGDGLYVIRILVKDPGAPIMPGVPAGHRASELIKIRIDNTRPKPVEITLDTGPCEEFTPGSVITGKFKAEDLHIWNYSFSVLPYSPPAGQFTHIPVVTTYPALTVPGVSSGTFKLNTADMKPCGYIIYLHVKDRAIINNYMQGNRKDVSVGFCLLKKK